MWKKNHVEKGKKIVLNRNPYQNYIIILEQLLKQQ